MKRLLLICIIGFAAICYGGYVSVYVPPGYTGGSGTISSSTEFVGSQTWGDGSTDTLVWTWNRATGTDPTITFNSGSIGLQALTVTGDIGLTGTKVTKGWFTDLEVTNAIAGSVTGSAATATTATNIAAGSANQIPYQTGAGATSFHTPTEVGLAIFGADPGADKISVWDDTQNIFTYADFVPEADIEMKEDIRPVFTLSITTPTTDNVDIKANFNEAITITSYIVSVTAGTSVGIGLYQVDADGIDSDATTLDTATINAGAATTIEAADMDATAIAIGEWIQLDLTAVTGEVTNFSITVFGYKTAI